MKKRLLSALLAVLMIFSAFSFVGCGGEEEPEEEKETVERRTPVTLTLWLPAAEGTEVDDEAVSLVERKVNEITQAAFTTAIKLKVLPADEYDAAVLAKIDDVQMRIEKREELEAQKREEARKEGVKYEAEDLEEEAVEEENKYEKLNAYLFTEYPSVSSTQFDIFVVHGYDEYKTLYDKFLLADLTETMNDEGKVLSSFVYPGFLNGVKDDMGLTYAIPNNRQIGKYQFMLINKKVASDLFYDPAEFTSVAKLFTYDNSGVSFIEDVKNNCPGVTPVVGKYAVTGVKYWNGTNDDTFSVLSTPMNKETTYDSIEVGNIMENTNFVNAIYYQKRIEEITTPAPVGSTDNFAVGFMEGTYEEMEKYSEDFHVVSYGAPVMSQDDIYESMLAVSTFTKGGIPDRAMEIVTLMNTNEEFRTVLQYGVEGTHWKRDVEDDSIIHVISDKYQMNMTDLGNAYMTYPADGVSIDTWQYSKDHNLGSFLPITAPFTSYINDNTAQAFTDLATASKAIMTKINGMSAAEFNDSKTVLKDEINALECVKILTYDSEAGEDSKYSDEQSIIYYLREFIDEATKED